MGCTKKGGGKKRVQTTTAEVQREPFVGWAPATGVDEVMAILKRYGVSTAGTAPQINFKLTIQTADVRPDAPNAWADLGSAYQGSDESNTGLIDVTGNTSGKLWFRLGVAYYLSGTAPTFGTADVELTTAVVSCGTLLGTKTVELVTFNTTDPAFVAITDWALVTDSDKVCAGIIRRGVSGNFQCKLYYRTAATSTQAPGAWTAVPSASWYSSNGESSTGDLTLTLGSNMYVQFGLGYSQTSASSTPGQATVTTTVSVRRT